MYLQEHQQCLPHTHTHTHVHTHTHAHTHTRTHAHTYMHTRLETEVEQATCKHVNMYTPNQRVPHALTTTPDQLQRAQRHSCTRKSYKRCLPPPPPVRCISDKVSPSFNCISKLGNSPLVYYTPVHVHITKMPQSNTGFQYHKRSPPNTFGHVLETL